LIALEPEPKQDCHDIDLRAKIRTKGARKLQVGFIKRVMKICIVTTAFPRWEKDTRGVFVYECALALHKQGHSVRVIAMHNPGTKRKEIMDGLEVIRPPYLPERWEILQKDSAGLPQVWKEHPWGRLAVIPFLIVHTLSVAFQAKDCDVIHANWTLSAFCVRLARVFHRRPYVVTVQGSDMFNAAKRAGIRTLTSWALKGAKKVLALSRALSEEVAGLGIPADRIAIVPNGVDTSRFIASLDVQREPIILFVGSLIDRKGVAYLVEAFHRLSQQVPDYRLVIVGEGSLKNSLVDLVQQRNLTERVLFTGPQSQEQVRSWMQRARVFVLPSLEEGQGVVVLEAMACGTPCVGTQVGGIPDMLVPEVGLLVPPENAEALERAIYEVIQDPQVWERMSSASRQRAQVHYDWSRVTARITTIYQE